MNRTDRLKRLKALQIGTGERPLFKSQDDCMNWVDNVAPLLKYDQDHYVTFCSHAEYVRFPNLSAQTIMPHLNAMIGVVNQAVIELEDRIQPPNMNSALPKAPTENSMRVTLATSADIWLTIESDYGITKRSFAKKINFVTDAFKRKVIFRDIEQAYQLANAGFSKPSVILIGSVAEELLRSYLEHKNIALAENRFEYYLQCCEDNKLLQKAIQHLSDSLRHFRNLVHLSREKTTKETITKAIAKSSVSSLFTLVNSF